jgi:8-oxo-dGTP pyrophosphatase MutT (NUDIX family)
MEFDKLLELLHNGILKELPGKEAHLTMSPQPVDLRRFDPKIPLNHRKSGVLLLFYPDQGNAFFPMIKRPEYKGVHSGQIALPGGKMEPEDVDVIFTALREAEEEVGVDPGKVQVLGRMSDLFIPTSNFLVSPVLGIVKEKPKFIPDRKEVERILETELRQLFDPSIKKRKTLEFSNSFKLDTPYFEIEQEMVWGATAMILGELIQLLKSRE